MFLSKIFCVQSTGYPANQPQAFSQLAGRWLSSNGIMKMMVVALVMTLWLDERGNIMSWPSCNVHLQMRIHPTSSDLQPWNRPDAWKEQNFSLSLLWNIQEKVVKLWSIRVWWSSLFNLQCCFFVYKIFIGPMCTWGPIIGLQTLSVQDLFDPSWWP